MGSDCMYFCYKDNTEVINNSKKYEFNQNKTNIHINNNNSNNNNKNKSMFIEHIKLQEKNKYDEFQKNLSLKLPKIGKLITKEQFHEKIPEDISTHSNMNKFQIMDNIVINKDTFELQPVELKNGDIYEGSWNENIEMDGIGKYYKEEEKLFFEGVWDKGKLIYGRIYYPNNNIYEGYISNFICHGKGKLIYVNGDIYEGEFSQGDFKGYGIMKWSIDKILITYEGEFSRKCLNNYGKLICNNGEQYEGNFKDNLFNGKGKFTFVDGSTYEGDFEYGKRNGKGIYIKKDDFSYEGSWLNDFAHGLGSFTKDNIIIRGLWRNGINAEIFSKEGEQTNDFNNDILNFNVPNISLLLPDRLPHLGSK